jgi:predicted phosphoribosyltransferase
MLYADRAEAGRALARCLQGYAGRADAIVLGLARGGVPVAYEVARALRIPLDVFIVRKLGVPGQPEFAMGAIASGGVRVVNEDVLRRLGISAQALEEVSAEQAAELRRRERLYRGQRPLPDLRGRTAIVVDDGLATGATMRASAAALRRLQPARIVAAVPVGAILACQAANPDIDETVCLHTPEPFVGVGRWYGDFTQIDDEEVGRLLAQAAHAQ